MKNLDKQTASVFKRFLAMMLDGFILATISYLLFGMRGSYTVPSFGMSIGPLMLSAVYFILQEASQAQATLGKRVLNIRIESSDDKALDFRKASLRFGAKLLSGLILMIGYIMALFNSQNLSLHDRIAKTRVVQTD